MTTKKQKTEIIENSITVTIANRRDDNTFQNQIHIKRYVRERKKYGKDFRVLIIDFDNQYIGKNIDIEQIDSFTNKVAIIGNNQTLFEERIKIIEDAVIRFKNGLLVLNNLNQYNLDKRLDICAALSICRGKSRDMLLSFGGSILDVPIKILENTDYVRIQRLTDSRIFSPKFKYKLYPHYLYEIAYYVQFMTLEFVPIITIDLKNEKLLGCTKKEYLDGIKFILARKISSSKSIQEIEKHFDYLKLDILSDLKAIPISNRDYIKTKKV